MGGFSGGTCLRFHSLSSAKGAIKDVVEPAIVDKDLVYEKKRLSAGKGIEDVAGSLKKLLVRNPGAGRA